MHIIACFGFLSFFLSFFLKVLQKQVCNLYQRILSSSDVPGKRKMPGMWGDEDLIYIYTYIFEYFIAMSSWQEQASWGKGSSHGPRAVRSLSLCPVEKVVFLWRKGPACVISARSDLFMGSKEGRTRGHVLLSPIVGFEAAFSSVSLGLQGMGEGTAASVKACLCPPPTAPPVHVRTCPTASPVPPCICLRPTCVRTPAPSLTGACAHLPTAPSAPLCTAYCPVLGPCTCSLPCPGQLGLSGPGSWSEAVLGPQAIPLGHACETVGV